jgi:hypothetical protein
MPTQEVESESKERTLSCGCELARGVRLRRLFGFASKDRRRSCSVTALGDLGTIDLTSAAVPTPVPLRFTGVGTAWLTSLFPVFFFNIQGAETTEKREIAGRPNQPPL